MAETISAQQLMFNSFTPKVANRFVMSVGDIPSFICKKVTRPGVTFGEVVIDHINTKRKLQGKADWNDVTMTLWDPIVPSGAQHVMEWVRKGYESATGAAGYPDFYKEDVTIEVLGPAGDIRERWVLKGAFPLTTEMGELDWSNDQPVEISVTLKYDYAVLEF
jgi:hypothetical protein